MNKRILLVSKFYSFRGGAEIVVINMANDFAMRGVDVGIFTMDYPENINCNNLYTAPNVNFKGGFSSKLKFAARTLGFYGVKDSFRKALETFRPDIVHLHNIHSYLSPAIIKIAKEFGCKVVWTLHDYKLLCPSYCCLNKGKMCELCFHDKRHVLSQRCMKNSFAASVLAYVEAKKWNREWIEKYVDYYIGPSRFMTHQLEKGGFKKEKLKVICNFVDPVKLQTIAKYNPAEKENYYVYVGRLSHEKGLETLLAAAKGTNFTLKVAGGGPLESSLREKYADCKNIEFLGKLNSEQVAKVLSHAKASVTPSEWYENNPLSAIESLCTGTPVIGSDIGGIPELISPETGYIFPSGDVTGLRRCIEKIMTEKFDYETIAKSSQERFSFETHYKLLRELYE